MNSSKEKDAVVDNEKEVDSSPKSSQQPLTQEPASEDFLNEEEGAHKQDTEYLKGWKLYMLTLG